MSSNAEDKRSDIASCFKKLLVKHPFEKITIQMIADQAGLSRQTFYNYFIDKSAVFEFILDDELFDSLYDLIELDMFEEAVEMIFIYFEKNHIFYYNAFKTKGQNNFTDILSHKIASLFKYALDSVNKKIDIELLTNEELAKYYTIGLVYILETWMGKKDMHNISASEISNTYKFLVRNSIEDIYEA